MGKKILIIEDELNIAELLRYNLTKNGFDVKCTLDGLDIINVVTEFRPELILLDLMLTEKMVLKYVMSYLLMRILIKYR